MSFHPVVEASDEDPSDTFIVVDSPPKKEKNKFQLISEQQRILQQKIEHLEERVSQLEHPLANEHQILIRPPTTLEMHDSPTNEDEASCPFFCFGFQLHPSAKTK